MRLLAPFRTFREWRQARMTLWDSTPTHIWLFISEQTRYWALRRRVG